MIIVNRAKELLSSGSKAKRLASEVYIKENNLKLWLLQGQVHFIELGGDYTDYCFSHRYYDEDLPGLMKLLFKTEDIDLALYCMIHTYREAFENYNVEFLGYLAVTNHPQYAQFFNTEGFSLKIGRWNNVPVFSPFAEAKPQNLNTKKITARKLVEAILAGQIKKVVCNGNHTDDWLHDEETGNEKGEWDLMDFANRLFTTETHSYGTCFYNIEREGNEISVWYDRGEWGEDYTVYLA